MKKKSSLIKSIVLFTILLTYQTVSSNNTYSNMHNEMAAFEENLLIYGLYAKYHTGPLKKYYPDAVSFTPQDLPNGLTLDLDTGILEGIPELDDGTDFVSYDPFVIIAFEDGTTRYSTLGEYTIIRPSANYFQLVDTKDGKVLSTAGHHNGTLTADITHTNNFAVVAGNTYLDIAAYYSNFEMFEPNGLAVDFFVNGSFFKRERIAPYALNGDVYGNFNNIPFKEGTYEISVKYYSTVFQKYISDTNSFTLHIINNQLDELVLYPNPASNSITIANLPDSDKNVSLTVIDILSNTVVLDLPSVSFLNNQIDIQQLNAGIYAAQFLHKNDLKVIEFMKE